VKVPGGKPVEFRRGRATVIVGRQPVESQTPPGTFTHPGALSRQETD
jgi:hypothetical protein